MGRFQVEKQLRVKVCLGFYIEIDVILGVLHKLLTEQICDISYNPCK